MSKRIKTDGSLKYVPTDVMTKEEYEDFFEGLSDVGELRDKVEGKGLIDIFGEIHKRGFTEQEAKEVLAYLVTFLMFLEDNLDLYKRCLEDRRDIPEDEWSNTYEVVSRYKSMTRVFHLDLVILFWDSKTSEKNADLVGKLIMGEMLEKGVPATYFNLLGLINTTRFDMEKKEQKN